MGLYCEMTNNRVTTVKMISIKLRAEVLCHGQKSMDRSDTKSNFTGQETHVRVEGMGEERSEHGGESFRSPRFARVQDRRFDPPAKGTVEQPRCELHCPAHVYYSSSHYRELMKDV